MGLASCGDADQAEGTPGAAVDRRLAEEGIDFDASTMDAMSVDVVAGGTPAASDPEVADAGIDMLGRRNNEDRNAVGTSDAN